MFSTKSSITFGACLILCATHLRGQIWLGALPVENSFIGTGRTFLQVSDHTVIFGFVIPEIRKNRVEGITTPEEMKETWKVLRRVQKDDHELIFLQKDDVKLMLSVAADGLTIYRDNGTAQAYYVKLPALKDSLSRLRIDVRLQTYAGQ